MAAHARILAGMHINYAAERDIWLRMREFGSLRRPTTIEIQNAAKEGKAEPERLPPFDGETWAVVFWRILDGRTGNSGYEYADWAAKIPTLSAWALPTRFDGNRDMTAEVRRFSDEPYLTLIRNPYYHKVDENGQQLPYYDTLEFHNRPQSEVNNAPILTGVPIFYSQILTYEDMGITSALQHTAYYRIAEAYIHSSPTLAYSAFVNQWREYNNLKQWISPWERLDTIQTGYALSLSFNYEKQEADWRTAAADPAFRVAVSGAIDRERLVYDVFSNHVQPATWISEKAALPSEYNGLEVPILLQIQNCLPLPDYETLLDLIVSDLQKIGLNARRMNDAESVAYQKGASGALAPALTLSITPSEAQPNIYAQLPIGWQDVNNDAHKAFTEQWRQLAFTPVEELETVWSAIGSQITELQPYIPLVDRIEALVYKAPSLQGITGTTMIEVLHGMPCWWKEPD